MDERIIHTKLYSNIASQILRSVEGQLSDGVYESSPAMEKYWRFSSVETAADGEVLLKVSAESSKYDKYAKKWLRNGFYGMSDAEVLKWFAQKAKHIMQLELKDESIDNGWRRDNEAFESTYLSYKGDVTVADVYFTYETLLGRDTARKYSIAQHMRVEGTPKSDAETAKEEARRTALAAIDARLQKDLAVHAEYVKERTEALQKELDIKRKGIIDMYQKMREPLLIKE